MLGISDIQTWSCRASCESFSSFYWRDIQTSVDEGKRNKKTPNYPKLFCFSSGQVKKCEVRYSHWWSYSFNNNHCRRHPSAWWAAPVALSTPSSSLMTVIVLPWNLRYGSLGCKEEFFLWWGWWDIGTVAWIDCGYPVIASVQSQGGWGFEQPDPSERCPCPCQESWMRWSVYYLKQTCLLSEMKSYCKMYNYLG